MDISEVAPGLYIASRFYDQAEGDPLNAVPIDCALVLEDNNEEQSQAILMLAYVVQDLLDNDVPVVLICEAGRNRSAVVAAKTLILMGELPEDAIMKVRRARRHLKGGALTNQAFVDYLRAGSR